MGQQISIKRVKLKKYNTTAHKSDIMALSPTHGEIDLKSMNFGFKSVQLTENVIQGGQHLVKTLDKTS